MMILKRDKKSYIKLFKVGMLVKLRIPSLYTIDPITLSKNKIYVVEEVNYQKDHPFGGIIKLKNWGYYCPSWFDEPFGNENIGKILYGDNND